MLTQTASAVDAAATSGGSSILETLSTNVSAWINLRLDPAVGGYEPVVNVGRFRGLGGALETSPYLTVLRQPCLFEGFAGEPVMLEELHEPVGDFGWQRAGFSVPSDRGQGRDGV